MRRMYTLHDVLGIFLHCNKLLDAKMPKLTFYNIMRAIFDSFYTIFYTIIAANKARLYFRYPVPVLTIF